MFKLHLLFLQQYNKNVECIIDKDGFPVCKTMEKSILHRYNINRNVPSYEPYIPRVKSIFYTCTTTECKPYRLDSIFQLSHPTSSLKNCYLETPSKYACETVKYQYYKNMDKLLFLINNIPTKNFYLADCLVYSNGERVCHRKADIHSHAKLVYTGTIVKPDESNNILSQDELICEETDTKSVYCEYNRYVPYPSGLKEKQPVKMAKKILLKSGSTLVPLKYKCKNNICGYFSDNVFSSRRSLMTRSYEPPGGSVYRCYYAKKQQICKKLYGRLRQVYNDRDWLIP